MTLAATTAYGQRRGAYDRALQPSILRTSGTATVEAPPDQATVNIGVVTKAISAEEAAGRNAAQVKQVLEAVKAVIGKNGKIQTRNYSVYPQRDNRGREITGYSAQNSVMVTIFSIDDVGEVLDAATGSGSNQINGITFGLRDDSGLRAEALQQAARKARADAEALAAGLGLRVKRILSIEEGQPATVQPYVRGMAEAMSVRADTPVEAGEVKVRATVTLTVEFEEEVR